MKRHSRLGNEPRLAGDARVAMQAQTRFAEGVALHQKGQLARAQEIYQEVLKIMPAHSEALHLSGVIAAQSRHFALAVDLISRSIAINPDNATACANRGNALHELQRYQAAIDSFEQAIAIKPDYANAHCSRAKALFALRRYRAAIDSYDQTIALRPDHAEAYCNRGVAWHFLRQYQTAVQSYDQAIAIQPGDAGAHYNRAIALNELKLHQAAIDSYDKALAINPRSVEAYSNRGNALSDLKRYQDAIASYDQAIAIKPDFKFLQGMRLDAKMNICDWGDTEDQIAQLTERIQRGQPASPPFPVLALSTSLPLQRKAAEIWVGAIHPPNPELGRIPKRRKGKKIRIAYFSMDFQTHPVSFLMAGLFESHDRDKFEVYAFSFGPDTQDEMRIRVEAAFDKFIDVQGRTDLEIAVLARQLEIDIAVDLAGFTSGSRTGIFALRAAPLQINYLGYPGTMGADYMDYLIADRQLIAEGARVNYAEKIVYLPSFQANDNQRRISNKVFSREELGLPQSGFVFCCFNNSYKITPDTFDGWMRILKLVERSVLWLSESTPAAAHNLRQQAMNRGVDAQRLVFAGKTPLLSEHLARQRAADLFLDTLPYNAHATASDALWAGLPVLTCPGEALASRVAASLLSAIGVPELIAASQEEYEMLAVALATNAQRLKNIRQKLERNRLNTPLFDTKQFTRHIEDAYTQMHERYHAGLPPEYIYAGQTIFS